MVLLASTSPAAVLVAAVCMIFCCCCGACCGQDGVAAAGGCRNDGVGCSAVAGVDKNAAEVDNIVADNGLAVGILPLPRLEAAVASCAREPMELERE